MTPIDLLADAAGRIPAIVHAALDGADRATLVRRLDPEANTLAWLAWHIAREVDAQLAPLAGTSEIWLSGGWADRAGLALPATDMGYGHTPEQVALVDADPRLLLDYLDAVHQALAAYLGRLTDSDLDAVVDERWDPPVSLGVRLVSIIGDGLEHAGQASFLRGVLDRTAA